MTEIETIAAKVLAAKVAEDIFGDRPGAADVTAVFRRLARILHPDHAGNDKRAADAMGRLSQFRDEADRKLGDGTYGKRMAPSTVQIATKFATYQNLTALSAGDTCDVYLADYQDGAIAKQAVIKLLRSPSDDDLATADWKAHEKLWALSDKASRGFQRYLRRPVETVKVDVDGKHRRANIYRYTGGRHSLGEVLAARPDGIDPRDMAWMWRRMLEVLSWVHGQGLVHGAVLPEHFLIRPSDHQGKLIGWSYSVAAGEKIRAISKPSAAWYAPEVAAKLPATPATDVYMAAKIALALVREPRNLPPKVAALLDACMIRNPARRHGDAVEVYKRFDEIIRQAYGPPAFRPFALTPA